MTLFHRPLEFRIIIVRHVGNRASGCLDALIDPRRKILAHALVYFFIGSSAAAARETSP